MQRIKELRKQKGLTQTKLSELLNVSRTTVTMWETGEHVPDIDTLKKIAQIFNTTVDYIVDANAAVEDTSPRAIRIPVLGSVPAGIPLEAVEDVIDWEELPQSMVTGGREYFALQVKGDSMWPDYLPGDVVIVRRQPTCLSGEDCVVYVNGYDATLKQVRLDETDHSLTFIPRNQSYPPRTFTQEEIQSLPVSIAGVVVELRRKVGRK